MHTATSIASVLVIASVVTCATGLAAIAAIDRTHVRVLRVAAGLCAAAIFAAVPIMVEHMAWRLRGGRYGWFIDLPILVLAIPPIAGLVVTLAAARRRRRSTRTWGWVLVWFAFLGIANTVNGCNPGWCSRYGFPFAFYGWSDAGSMSFSDVPPENFHPLAATLNVTVAVIGAIVILRRRSRHEADLHTEATDRGAKM